MLIALHGQMIPTRLKEIRILLGYGDRQKEFAEKLDMKQGSYSDVERGKTKSISKKLIRNLYTQFGVNEAYILHGTLPKLLKEKKTTEPIQEKTTNEQLLVNLVNARDRQIDELLTQQGKLLLHQEKMLRIIQALSIGKKEDDNYKKT